jgi:hypothetical protein
MATTLHLGVIDIQYSDNSPSARPIVRRPGKPKPLRPSRRPSTTTTGDVAEILEAKYGVFSAFTLLRGKDIQDAVEGALRGKLETLAMGGPVSMERLFDDVDLAPIEEAFRDFLNRREMDGRAAGVPTRAAERGVNPRLAHPYSRSNPSRPSFIASGTLQNSFKVWSDD